MRFIRSKGHSYTHASEISEISEVRPLKRSLVVTRRQTVGNKEPIQENLSHYAKTDPDLLIRQYISAIDKVISKPTEIGRFTETKTEIQAVTEDWYSHREALGASCWTLLEKRLRDTGLENTVLASLRPTWRWKLHPYAVEETANEDIVRIRRNFKAAEKRAGKEKKHFKPIYKKGRWYDVFWALDASGNPDFPTIAEKISRHLFEQEITLGPKPARVGPVEQKPRQGRDKKVSGIGLIEKRASSIESSVYPSASDVGKLAADWSSADEEKYSKGDIAPKIFGIAKAKEEKRGRLTTSDVGKLLYQNYADVELNKHHNVAENEEFKGLLALHQAVKEFYKSKIRTSKRGRDDAQGKLSEVLPRNNKKLFELLVQQDENGHINNLIRQGRNVFYQTMAAAAHTTTGTPLLPNIDFATHFRTSNGQAEIKRSEAFVRVWRSVISQAGRTAKAWADPDGAKGDVFEEQPIQDLTGNLFNQTNYRAKLDVLFGDKAECFKSNRSIDESNVLQAALRIGQRLRRVAHFYDRKSFVKEIEGSIKQDETTDSTKVSIQKLVNTDWADLDKRLIDDLEGVRLHDFSDSKQIEQLIDELKSPDVGDIALPRFNRLLDGLDGIRAKIIDKKDFRLSLPKRVNTRTEPSTLCKFACMKRLYERPFRPWLESIHACELQKMINQVRTEGALRAQDTLSSNPFKNLIRSKAENLPDLGDRKLVGYFDDLAREVAIENRHQNAYEPNPEAAREQSEWIEDFKCNLLAIAFVRYLNEKRFSWLLQLPHEPRNGSKPGTYPDQKSATVVTFAAWEANLYFFLHLVPIDDVARLIHQLRKTAVLDRKATEDTDSSVKRLQDLLSLYK